MVRKAAHVDLLSTLGKQYGTDKVEQGFTKIYHLRLRAQRLSVTRILEVGVYFGSSLRMWRDYFPNATVVGVDTFRGIDGWSNVWGDGKRTTFPNADKFLREWKEHLHGPRLHLVVGNQSDDLSMQQVTSELQPWTPFDIIVEDGSHLNRDQQVNLAQLLPLIKPGGLYILEDLHCSLQSGYDDPLGSYNTALKTLERFNRTRKLRSRHLTATQSSLLEAWIEAVEIAQTPKHKWTSFITKRQTPRHPGRIS